MKNCKTCKAVNIDETMFCLKCGGGNLEPIGDAFPWEESEKRFIKEFVKSVNNEYNE